MAFCLLVITPSTWGYSLYTDVNQTPFSTFFELFFKKKLPKNKRKAQDSFLEISIQTTMDQQFNETCETNTFGKASTKEWIQSLSYHAIPRWDWLTCTFCASVCDSALKHLPHASSPQQTRIAIRNRMLQFMGPYAPPPPYIDQIKGPRGAYNTLDRIAVANAINTGSSVMAALLPNYASLLPPPVRLGPDMNERIHEHHNFSSLISKDAK